MKSTQLFQMYFYTMNMKMWIVSVRKLWYTAPFFYSAPLICVLASSSEEAFNQITPLSAWSLTAVAVIFPHSSTVMHSKNSPAHVSGQTVPRLHPAPPLHCSLTPSKTTSHHTPCPLCLCIAQNIPAQPLAVPSVPEKSLALCFYSPQHTHWVIAQ